MIKTYCDVCYGEMEAPTPKLIAKVRHSEEVRVDIILGVDQGGTCIVDLCKYCILNAVAKLDDRVRQI